MLVLHIEKGLSEQIPLFLILFIAIKYFCVKKKEKHACPNQLKLTNQDSFPKLMQEIFLCGHLKLV
jgi:hypothetical protein